MKEYVKMEEQISSEEFLAYYKQVMDKLQLDFEQLTENELFQAKIITTIMSGNAASRQKKKGADVKKFRKIGEKTKFWEKAIEYKLKKSGLSEADIKNRSADLEKEM
jgi:hypothetical protein